MTVLSMPSDDQIEQLAAVFGRDDLAVKNVDMLTAEARYHREQAELHHQQMLHHSVELGRRLLEIKTRVPHGEYVTTVADEIGLGQRQAWNLMHLARNQQRVADLPPDTSLRGALETIKEQKQEERAANGRVATVPSYTAPLPNGIEIEVADATDLPLGDGLVDLTVTSPPYGLGIDYADTDDDEGYTTYLERVDAWCEELFRVAADNGRLCLNVPLDITYGGTHPIYADWLTALLEAGWQYRTTIVWDEDNVSKTTARGSVDSPSSPHVIARVEMIAVVFKGEWNLHRGDRCDLEHEEWLEWTNGLWRFSGEHRDDHPSPFPEELPRRLIKLFSFPGDVIMDPFLGSGTTAVAGRRLGRQVYGFDRSPKYVDSARARVAKER